MKYFRKSSRSLRLSSSSAREFDLSEKWMMKCTWIAVLSILLSVTLLEASTSPVPPFAKRNSYENRDEYEDRVTEYLNLCVHADTLGAPNLFTQIARMELGEGPLDPGVVEETLEFVNSRLDCSDFRVAGLIRILYQYAESPLLDESLLNAIIRTVLDFKYWIDEPGKDSMCYWSENHQILFHSAEYLAGQLLPDELFSNSGLRGWQHAYKARPRIERWLECRFYMGFSEWHSNVYYDKDLAAVLNLADFAADEDIAIRAAMIADLILFDIAVNSHEGIFGVSHGRTYAGYVTGGWNDITACSSKLMSGEGIYNSRGNMSAVTLATSYNYRPPEVLQSIGADHPEELVNRERMGIHFCDASTYGLTFEDSESGMFWWGMGAYADWRVVDLTFQMLEEWDLWENDFFGPAKLFRPLWERGWLPYLSWLLNDVTSGSVLSQVNTYTFRTPDYMLAAAQDQRHGELGYQQHAWQATIDRDAVVFSSHPGSYDAETPGYWTGGWMPKVVQERNVVIAIYEWKPSSMIFPRVVIPYTHAYVPRYAFDEMYQCDHWTFCRKGDAYLALYSDRATRWAEEGEWAGVDLIADGTPNVWICEMGSRRMNGSFDRFMDDIEKAFVCVMGTCVTYHSPGVGRMHVSLITPLRVDWRVVKVDEYPRYDNPYAYHEFGDNPLEIAFQNRSLYLDFDRPERIVND
jgi:hypothetical protein